MQVRNAKSEDLAEVMRCVEAARNYMRANGNPHQWTDGYPSEELLTNDIKNQQLYVCVGDDDKIHGVFAFIIGADPTYAYIENGAWLNDEPYGAIHRIGSDGEAKGIFAAAINYCKGQIKNLRIDTHEKNHLKLNRVAGCDFDIGVFTNFSEDHISPKEHPDMQDYFNSKLKLLKMCKVGFTNADDLMVAKVPKLLPECNITTYGIDNYCNLLAKDITITNSYVDFKVKLETRNERVKVCIPGRFSVYNALAAISIAKELNCSAENIKDALLEVRVPGRSELVNNSRDLTIMIDYAHSPESLENILSAVKSYTRGRVISVFGCGGDRDSGKRPIMGEISGRIADYTIITSDNPRTEDPQKIVDQIEEGIKKTKANYEVIVDRTQAIEAAIKMANKKDIIVLAGKGHEPYQEINGVKHPFDERIIVNEIIEKLDSKQSDKKKSKK